MQIVREAQDHIIKKDQALLLTKASNYHHLHKIAECVGWKKLWDHALVHGLSVLKGVKNLVGVINYPDYATSKCPLCDQMLPSWIRHPWLNTLLLNTQKVKAPGALSDHHETLFLQSMSYAF